MASGYMVAMQARLLSDRLVAVAMSVSPGQLLDALLKQRHISKAELGRRLDRDYLAVHRWTKDQQFTTKNQRAVCREFGLPLDYFERPELLEHRERVRREVFEAFTRSPLGSDATEEELRVLESVRFVDTLLPTVALYQAFLLTLRGHLTRDQAAASIDENHALDVSIRRKLRPPSNE